MKFPIPIKKKTDTSKTTKPNPEPLITQKDKKPGRFHIKNPIAEFQHKREEEKRLKEEEKRRKAEEEKRRKEEELRRKREEEQRKLKQMILMLLICLCLFGLIGLLNKNASSKTPSTLAPTAEPETKNMVDLTPTPTTESTEPASNPNSTPSPISTETPVPSSETEPDSAEQDQPIAEPTATPEPNPYHKIDLNKISLSCYTDYSHFNNEIITQGNDEAFTINIDTKNPDATLEDILIFDEDDVFNTLSAETISEGRFQYRMQTNVEGYHKLYIFASFDLYEYGENAEAYIYDVHKLSWRDGQIVYLSYSGEKYHKTAKHAGDSYTATTLYDAESMSIEPCGTCY